MKKLIFVNGTMGAGKSAVCKELSELLPNNVYLDGDWCWNMRPFTVNEKTKEMVLDNICHLLQNFLRFSGFENIIFGWVMQDWSIAQTILSRLDLCGAAVYSFTLMCSQKTLRARLEKDIENGLRTEDIVARSISRLPLYETMPTEHIATDQLTPKKTAIEIIRKIHG